MAARDPLWARWRVRAVPVQPWARVRLDGRDGPIPARLLSIGRGWVSGEVGGRVHRCGVEVGERVVWAWVRRAVEVGGAVEGLREIH